MRDSPQAQPRVPVKERATAAEHDRIDEDRRPTSFPRAALGRFTRCRAIGWGAALSARGMPLLLPGPPLPPPPAVHQPLEAQICGSSSARALLQGCYQGRPAYDEKGTRRVRQ